MPCINRIRIINFSYNNDVRHILDETFDFHGGENAVLNLANGGGKSVLVQLMLQPVVPRARIQGRNIGNFFRKQKRPAYVLIEWKLDGAGGYLLTGIGLASEETRTADEDENGGIRHFTFLCTYNRAIPLDLANIELVRHDDGIVQITPYKIAQDMMREAARKDPYAVSYFPQSEKEEHRRKLLQFGISPDEWSNVMKRINDSEGGLEEIFAKCKTSDQLLDIWLMRTIEKNLPSGSELSERDGSGHDGLNMDGQGRGIQRRDGQRRTGYEREGGSAGLGLQRMFENLLEETLNSEGLLMEQQRLARFLPEFEILKEQASDLAGRLERLKTTGAEMSAMHGWLGTRVLSLETSREENSQSFRELERQRQRVLHEERSEPVHAARQAREAAGINRVKADEERQSAESEWVERDEAYECMKAAHIGSEREQLSAALAEVAGQMRGIQENDDRALRMEQLRAALWVRWQERLSAQQKLATQEKKNLQEAEEQKRRLHERAQANRKEQVLLEKEKARLLVETARFEEREQRVSRQLEIDLSRNLSGELLQNEKERIATSLSQKKQQVETALASREREEVEITEALLILEVELRNEANIQGECQAEIQQLERETEQWRLRTEERLETLRRNNMTGTESREMALSELRRIQHDLVRRISLTEQEHHEAASLQEDLRNGRFHVSADWVRQLTEADVPHQTGESYLRSSEPAERERLLQRLPFLPYAILLTTESLTDLPERLQSEVRRGVVPILTYEGLRAFSNGDMPGSDDSFSADDSLQSDDLGMRWENRAYFTQDGKLLLATLYNREALEPESVGRLLAETGNVLNRLTGSIENLRTAHQGASRDLQILEAYPYQTDWKRVQDAKQTLALKKLETANQQIASLQATTAEKNARKGLLLRMLIPEAREAIRKSVEQSEAWQALLEDNERYEDERRQMNVLDGRIRSLIDEADTQRKALDELDGLDGQEGRLRKLDRAHTDAERTEQEVRQKRDQYAEWSSTDLLLSEGTCEALEGQLSELVNTLGMELKHLQLRHDERTKELAQQEKAWMKIPQSIREGRLLPVWDEASEDRLEKEVKSAQALLEKAKKDAYAADKQEALLEDRLKTMLERLFETGLAEPLPEGEIHGRYTERKKEQVQRERELKQESVRIGESLQLTETDRRRIVDAGINPEQVRPAASLRIHEDGKAQLEALLTALRDGNKEAVARKDAFRIRYDKARNVHAADSELIRNLFDGLNAMLERATDSYEPFYFLYERMQDHAGILSQQIAMLKARLEGLDRSRTDVVEHCFMHGRRMVEELQRIEKNSVVRLEGRSTSTSMLKVVMNEVNEHEARERMVQHVEKSIELMKEEMRSGKEARQARSAIERLIRSRELLNQYLGTTRIPVQVYKIDLNMGNSRFKYWEDAVRENSGGEKFVVYFSVLTALMAYTRAAEQATLASPGEAANRESRHVLIMDNPFGPISSIHLLKPLFEIAKRYRTQLICLTDLKQSSILNNFNLVYMLRIRKGAASADEYLKWDEFKRSEDVPENDESLEKAFFRVSDYTQMKLGD